MGSFLVAFAALSGQELVGLALGSRWDRPSSLAVLLLEQVDPPNGQHQSTGFRVGLDHFWAAPGGFLASSSWRLSALWAALGLLGASWDALGALLAAPK